MYSANFFTRGAGRLLIVLAILAITLTVMGMTDLGKDAFGSHNDIALMPASDFRDGDMVHLNITETLGCAATVETTEYTLHVFKTNQYNSAYYYVLPYYTEEKGGIPDRIVMFRTGNENQSETLSDLTYETLSWYLGQSSDTYSHLKIDRAEVKYMTAEETSALRDYLDRFVEAYYNGSDAATISRLKVQYENAIVPYVVQYRAAGGGNTMLTVGLVMLGIFIVVVIVIILKNRGTSSMPEYTYIGAKPPTADPNLNSPTGLSNATGTMFGSNTYKAAPSAPMQPTGYRENYNNSVRPLPPMNTGATPAQPQKRRIENFDPFTGKPVRAKQTLMEAVLATPPVPSRRPQTQPTGDTMPTVDPGSEANVDLSNGGVLPEDKAKYFAAMPKNGDIPVVNPDSLPAAGPVGGAPLTAEPAEEPKPDASAVTEVTPIHPPTSKDNLAADFRVEQTDPSARNIYSHIAGGEMNAVDPYTEKNVDISNGGIELPEQDDAGIRRDFPSAVPFAAVSEPVPAPSAVTPAASYETPAPSAEPSAPSFTPSASEIRTDFPTVDTSFPEPTEPKEPEGYNIFKTGSSYNIFKSDDKKDDSGSIGSMGFPVESKDFPKVDTSFPTAGESDVGGKDDFVF